MRKLAPHPRGFTLVETMIVLAIIAVLALLSVGALDRIRYSADTGMSMQNLSSLIAEGRMQAMRRSYPVMLLAYVPTDTTLCPKIAFSSSSNWTKCARFYLIADGGPTYASSSISTLGDYDPDGDLTSANDTLIERLVWSSYVKPVNSGTTAPDAPYSNVPTTSACSFCTLTATNGSVPMGAMIFWPDGTVSFSGGSTLGGSLVMQGRDGTGGTRTLVVTAPLGHSRLF